MVICTRCIVNVIVHSSKSGITIHWNSDSRALPPKCLLLQLKLQLVDIAVPKYLFHERAAGDTNTELSLNPYVNGPISAFQGPSLKEACLHHSR